MVVPRFRSTNPSLLFRQTVLHVSGGVAPQKCDTWNELSSQTTSWLLPASSSALCQLRYNSSSLLCPHRRGLRLPRRSSRRTLHHTDEAEEHQPVHHTQHDQKHEI